MLYRVRYHREVVDWDIPALDGSIHQRFRVAIERRLATEPARYGKPLGGSLASLRRLRVGDYRVVFRITGDEVLVIAIGHRQHIYTMVGTRDSTVHKTSPEYRESLQDDPSRRFDESD